MFSLTGMAGVENRPAGGERERSRKQEKSKGKEWFQWKSSYCPPIKRRILRPLGWQVRPLDFYSVDISEFAVNKLLDRGSLTVKTIVTNVQDFIIQVRRGVCS